MKLGIALVLALALPQRAMALSTNDLLSLVAMPLAVAAVADLTGVPQGDLTSLVASLNQANVPPAQFVEVVRYVPVALVADNRGEFVNYIQQQVTNGVQGDALVTVIEQRLPSYGVREVQLRPVTTMPPQVIVVDQQYIPPVVRQRVEYVRVHPHGGPPGQIKKMIGARTGAEVVHRVVVQPPMASASPSPEVVVIKPGHGHGRGHAKEERRVIVTPAPMQPVMQPQPQPLFVPPGQAKQKDHGDGGGKGKGHGKGKD